jgi:hypothetical protein
VTERTLLAYPGGPGASGDIGRIAEQTGADGGQLPQRHPTGESRMTPHAGRAVVRRSDTSPYDFGLATFDVGDGPDQFLAKGSVEVWGQPSKLEAVRDARNGDAQAVPAQ